MILARTRLPSFSALALVLAGATLATPSFAQDDAATRIKKLEAEVRALQRKVFPGGDGKYFEAQIAAPATTAAALPAPAETTAVTALLNRVDGLETALARATAQNEENANRLAKLEARLVALDAAATAPATTGTDAAPDATATAEAAPRPSSITGSLAANTAAMAATARPSEDRIAAVAAIEKPASGDKGEDDYLYGYRLWEAKFFPEATQQLKATVDKYPRHKRISYARNLLGRAYLDDGKPGTAAQVFLQNYQADKAGDRAPDSLLYLAVAMAKLKETQRACVALAEFAEAYPAEAGGRLAGQYASAKSAVKCN
jgi:TolA-binding protein